MTFTTRVKEEISKLSYNRLEATCELSAFFRANSEIKKSSIKVTIENASVARRIYTLTKELFNINLKITVRNQKRFRIKQIYILEIKEKINDILETLNIYKDGKKTLPELYFLETEEEQMAFIRGLFLACGSTNDPATSGYHFEFTISSKKEAMFVSKLLKNFDIIAKVLKRNNHYMVYIKSAEMISDLLKIFGATNSLFYFEDIRIYRDHKNMVNRLNNCELANEEKTIKAGLKQLETISYLEENDLIGLLDERTMEVVEYRKKYPETSYNELASIISLETGKQIGKSGINHYFIKMNKLKENHEKQSKKC